MELEKLELDCKRIPDILRTEEIIMINNLITDPDNMVDVGLWEGDNKIRDVELGGPELEIGRDEDYHQVKSRGLIETLIESMIPMECREDSNVLRLTSVLMAEIAQNQAFYEGNKRTAYVVGTLFLIKCQLFKGDEAIYPRLDREMTDKLAALAIDNTGEKDTLSREQFQDYLQKRLS